MDYTTIFQNATDCKNLQANLVIKNKSHTEY